MKVHDVEQRSPEWKALRLGRLCASRAGDMLATIKNGEAAARRNLRMQLVLERITGRSQERDFVSQAMQDGIEREADALARYQAMTGTIVLPVGFVSHDTLMAGASPDGIVVGWAGGVEIKCPIEATHYDFLKTGQIPSDYVAQMTAGLWLTGLPWWDFVSFQPSFPDGKQIKVRRWHRDDAEIDRFDRMAKAFLAEVDREVDAFRTMADPAAAFSEAVA